ncbi:MAG: hypothetical protein NVS3B20_14600 [Polyangiales bacterium]
MVAAARDRLNLRNPRCRKISGRIQQAKPNHNVVTREIQQPNFHPLREFFAASPGVQRLRIEQRFAG